MSTFDDFEITHVHVCNYVVNEYNILYATM